MENDPAAPMPEWMVDLIIRYRPKHGITMVTLNVDAELYDNFQLGMPATLRFMLPEEPRTHLFLMCGICLIRG